MSSSVKPPAGGVRTDGPTLGATADPQVSPCTGVCLLDAGRGLCRGCARTGEEIAGWAAATPASRAATWAALAGRRAALGLRLYRLPWAPADLVEFGRRSAEPGAGTWAFGVPGALAEFSTDRGERVAVDVAGRSVTVVTPRGALRLAPTGTTRALAVALGPAPEGGSGTPPPPQGGDRPVIVVVTPRPPAGPGGRARVTAVGPDRGAIRPADRGAELFDLGVGSAVARFAVRTTHPGLLERLRRVEGRPWPELVASSGELLVEVSPTRVVETALGRVEVAAPIPPGGGASPDGPHTHLLAEHLVDGRETPPGVELPPGWAQGGIWYPDRPADAPAP